MSIKVNSNFSLGSKTPLDSRQVVATLDDLLALDENIIYDGMKCYVKNLDAEYKFNSNYNETDTGHWKLINSDGGVIDDELNINSTNAIQNKVVTEKFETTQKSFEMIDAGAVTGYELFRDGVSIYADTACSSYTDTISTLSGTSIQYTCTVTYADGTVKNDNIGDPNTTGQILAGSITGTASKINIALKYYYGNSATNTISSLSSLNGVLDTKKDLTLKFTANDEYLILAYDSSYGDLSKIYDQNKFDNTSSWTATTLTSGAFTYNVYVTNNKVTCSDFSYDFKF